MMTLSSPSYLPGIDLQEGLERFSGNWETFLRIMRYFVKSHESAMKDLNDVLSREEIDFGDLSETAHKIKGAAANLSAVDLRQHALKLEQAAKSGDAAAVRNNIRNVLNSYHELRDVIERMNS